MATISTENMDAMFNFIQKISKETKETTIRNINTIINEERDNLSDLKFALEMRYRFLQNSSQSSIEYDYKSFLEDIRNSSVTENLQENLYILRLFLLMSFPNAPLLLFLDCFQNLENYNRNKNTKSNVIKELEIMNVALDVINLEKYGKELMCEQNVHRLINIAFEFPTNDVRNLINCILKKLDATGLTFNLLKLFWERIEETCDYNFLCSLADYYFLNSTFEIYNQESYWTFIQKGIVSDQYKTRKQSMYLLKRSVDTVFGKLCWMVQDTKEVWSHFFILMETLEEKQAHLVMPAFHLLKNIRIMNYSWKACVYQRMLQHCNSKIQFQALIELFQEVEMDVKKIVFKSHLLESFFKALNNIEIYTFIENEDMPVICQHFKHFFKILDDRSLNEFIEKSLKIDWTPVSLFYITYALKKLNENYRTVNVPFDLLKKFIKLSTQVKNIFIRRAVQCNFIKFITIMPRDNFSIYEISELMEIFSAKECLKRGTVSWNNIKSWLSSELVEVPIDDSRIKARTLVLLFDSGSIDYSNLQAILKFKLDRFCELSDNYCEKELLDELIAFFNDFFIELDFDWPDSNDFNSERMKIIIKYMKKKLMAIKNVDELDSVDMHVLFFELLLKYKNEGGAISNDISNFGEWLIEHLGGSFMKQYFAIKLLNAIDLSENKNFTTYKYEKIDNLKQPQDFLNQEDGLKLSGKVVSAYYDALMDIKKKNLFSIETEDPHDFIDDLDKYWFDILNNVESGRNLKSTLQLVFELLMYSPCDIDTTLSMDAIRMESFIDTCWKLSNHDSSCVCQFIKTFLSFEYAHAVYFYRTDLKQPFIKYRELIVERGRKCSEILNFFIFTLFMEVNDLYFSRDLLVPLCDLLSETIIFGPVPRRDQRIFSDCYKFILANDDYGLFEEWKRWNEAPCDIEKLRACNYNTDISIRMWSVKLLFKLLKEKGNEDFIREFFEKLLLRSDAEYKPRYFGDSFLHRLKNRILQVLLILQPYLNPEQNETLLKWLCKSLYTESHQPSVRYQQEWLVIRILQEYPNLMIAFDEFFNIASEVRNGSLVSFIFIIYHWTILNMSKQTLDKALTTILPLAMGQNLNVRLYAQIAIKFLYESAEKNFTDATDKYSAIYKTVVTSLNQVNANKNVNKLSDDLFFVDFDPMAHYSFETIFKDLPRLTNCPDESINIENYRFEDYATNEGIGRIPLKSENNHLSVIKTSLWLHKINIKSCNDDQNNSDIIQKKIVPWNSMGIDLNVLSDYGSKIIERKTKSDGLVVIASLIDKTPNLGGLCRTCEIFGVTNYVIDNLKHTENEQFLNLSMSAEKWMNITEVKSYFLKNYILEMKSKGYTVVGAEQSPQSEKLNNFIFPVKTVILLGNEKQGIPADLLGLLDKCVEVPQRGLIRSLNVHVTGALLIWEYAKQITFRDV